MTLRRPALRRSREPKPAPDGPLDAGTVRFLFRHVLEREPTAQELADREGGTLEQLVADLRGAAGSRPARADVNDVRTVFEAMLWRPPRDADLEALLAGDPSLAEVVRAIAGSDERREVLAREEERRARRVRANMWTRETAPWTHSPGTVSPDGMAIVGHDGFCFLRTGTNVVLQHHLGHATLADGWLDAWHAAVDVRRAAAQELGVRLAMLVVPDKLAVHPERYPEPLEPVDRRPVERLVAAELPLVHPIDDLRAAAQRDDVYLRTDSHLTLVGNLVVFARACRALGVEPPDVRAGIKLERELRAGDLGSRFDPQICELFDLTRVSAARLEEDNRAAVAVKGGHIGTRRVWRNSGAQREETVVVFGDSYAFGDETSLGLSWLLAQAFRSVHFVWVPFGWDPAYVQDVEASLVVCETAERFLVRAPRAGVDVRALVDTAVDGGSAAHTPDVVFER